MWATVVAVLATVLWSAPAAASDPQPPTTPGNLAIVNVTPTSVTLAWAASTDDVGVTDYEVFRAIGGSNAFAPVGTTATTSFTNTGLTPGSLYRYQVRARDAAGNVSAFTTPIFVITPGPCTTPPPPPGSLRLLAVGPTSVSLRWTIAVPSLGCSPAGFDVLRATGASGGTFTRLAQTGMTDTFVDTTVSPNTTYRYQVRSRSANGLVSGPSNTVQVTTAQGGCTAAYRVLSPWDGGFQGEVTVTNTGTGQLNGWQVTLALSDGAAITRIWGGLTGQTASPYTITNEAWNGALAPNASTTVGFLATVAGSTGATGTVGCG